MKIGIDTFGCEHSRSGIGTYLQSFVRCLPKNANIQYELFGPEMDRYTYESEDEHIPFVSCAIPDSIAAERFWHFFYLSKFAKKQKYDCILIPAGSRMLPLKSNIPVVAVVQDVLSDHFFQNNDRIFNHLILRCLKKTSAIIAASQFVKKNLVNLHISSEIIEVVHNGIDHSLFYPHTELDGDFVDIKPFAIKRPYFIYPSRLQNLQKKHIELIRGFSLFKKKTGFPHRLVLAGSEGPVANIIHKEAVKSPYASDIFITGYFPHESLPEFYSCAEACVFPSVSEGVGLPVLEAMSSGLPVACAKSGVLSEIAGNNAVYFNSDDVSSIASALESIASDNELRHKLIEGGFEWTKRFSWEKTAERTIEIITSLIEKNT